MFILCDPKASEIPQTCFYTFSDILLKVFSTVLYLRIQARIDGHLSDEQYGFRRGQGCSDAVHVLRMVIEKSAEWGEDLWIAALDVEKAFDRVHHSALFDALLEAGVEWEAISSLKRLYAGTRAYVNLWTGVDSRAFDIERGVRQGDTLSPLLFNLVMNRVLDDVLPVWRKRGCGTNVGMTLQGQRLTHCAFADDMTLISRSWLSMKRMMAKVRASFAKYGLTLHPAKCKVQTNRVEHFPRGSTVVKNGFAVEILPEGASLTVLGTHLNLDDPTKYEITNRIAAGWRMFWAMSKLLMNRKISINRWMRVLDSTVGSCVLWCTESWTPRTEEMQKLESARRSMLRKILGLKRGSDEDWIQWLQRCTRKALSIADQVGVRSWVSSHLRRKWFWAGHLARRGLETWLLRTTAWRDSCWQSMAGEVASRPLRPTRRRWMKWEDVLRRYSTAIGGPQWMTAAAAKTVWNNEADKFLEWCNESSV